MHEEIFRLEFQMAKRKLDQSQNASEASYWMGVIDAITILANHLGISLKDYNGQI